MPTYPTQFFSGPFAASGDKTIIGAEPVATGRASLPEGFPPITATPISQGGIAPQREDFNGILYMLSAIQWWQQSGGMWQFNSALDYAPPAIVLYSGQYWQCVQACGASSQVVAPGSNAAYWQPLPQFLFQNYPVTLGGDVSGNGTANAGGLNVPVTVNQAAKLKTPVTITFGGDVSGSVTFDGSNPSVSANLSLQVSIDATPVGTIIMYWGNSAPSGYFVCNGGSFDGNQYPQLQAVIGSTTLPDLRNQFIRGAAPGSRNTGYSETDAGRNVTGSFGANDFMNDNSNPWYTGAFFTQQNAARDASDGKNGKSWEICIDASRVWGAEHTAAEFRPTNVALLFCIKHD